MDGHYTFTRRGREDVGESNFVVECTCGEVVQVATLNPEFAEEVARNHVEAAEPATDAFAGLDS